MEFQWKSSCNCILYQKDNNNNNENSDSWLKIIHHFNFLICLDSLESRAYNEIYRSNNRETGERDRKREQKKNNNDINSIASSIKHS